MLTYLAVSGQAQSLVLAQLEVGVAVGHRRPAVVGLDLIAIDRVEHLR